MSMAKQFNRKLTPKQKAAIIMVAIGPDAGSKIMPFLTPTEIEELTVEVARTGSVQNEVRLAVLREFHELCAEHQGIAEGGLGSAQKLLQAAFGDNEGEEILNRVSHVIQMLPFDAIKNVDPTQLASFLQDEHPQTIALVLAYLDPPSAAAVINALQGDLAPEVAERLAMMGSTPPEVIRRVEEVLEKKLSSVTTHDFSAAGGIKALVDVLGWVDRNTERQIMETLAETNPELLEEVRKMMFTFDDLVQLDDRAMQQVLKEVDLKELALALKACSEAVRDKVFKSMSERAVNMLKEEIEYMGRVRMRVVEEAQQRVVSVVRRLEDAGEIVLAHGAEEEMV